MTFIDAIPNLIMKKFHLLLLVLMLQACSLPMSYEKAMLMNERRLDQEQRDDYTFLVDAQSLNKLEIKMNKLAATEGYSAAAVSMAKKNLDEHELMEREIRRLARKQKIKIPSELKPEHEALLDELRKTPEQYFDKNYARILKQVNEETTYRYEHIASQGTSTDLRTYAARRLEVLREHAGNILAMEKKLLETY